VNVNKSLIIGLGALAVLTVVVGLAFASDASPTEEPVASPYFDATLQQAVDELDGKARSPTGQGINQPQPTSHYTTDPALWPECQFGYTQDPIQWPWCHYTSDPELWPECNETWPTKDYTWDTTIWPECDPTGGPAITQDPTNFWCDPSWTHDPAWGPQCDTPAYTRDATTWPWCNPLYTWDPAQWPSNCFSQPPYYTESPDMWPECNPDEYTMDPYRWRACHYTSDPWNVACASPYPTQDYTSNPQIWPECDPLFTTDPGQYPCEDPTYTTEAIWPWCNPGSIPYTADPYLWPVCHYTSDPEDPDCGAAYPTKDYTWDINIWPECETPEYTQSPALWPWCDPASYTFDPDVWPWCAPNWTWDPGQWTECQPGYTNDPDVWPECERADGVNLYTRDPQIWPECQYYTADARIWPACHYTSDVTDPDCEDNWWPTKDYTTDLVLWPECDVPPDYTSDPLKWPSCHYTSDPTIWSECEQQAPLSDLGDAPDQTNHTGSSMTAYAGVNANYPVVFDAATGFPQGPKHLYPRADAWLGPTVTLEFDADLLPDQDTWTNIDPVSDTPDRDVGDDGVNVPVPAPHCERTWFTYTVTVPPGSVGVDRYVNVWFDWLQDGDWDDMPYCPPPAGALAPEWAVQNQLIPGGLPPGTYVFATPPYLAWFPQPADPEEIWMRISIAEQPAPQLAGAPIADGRGPVRGYVYGETEDYRFQPSCPEPVADFVWDPPTICPTTTVQFWDTSFSATPIHTWAWDFGDGLGTSSLQNPTYTYSTAGVGSYDVSLTVRNVCGSDTVTKTLVVTDCVPQEPDYDIYLKDSYTDDGSVPSSVPWWNSPDTWVRNDGDCSNTTHQNPLPGLPTTICVRVRNRMATTVNDTTVNVYWANASLSLSWPVSWSYIGNVYIPSLAGGATTTQALTWNVPYFSGHLCLLARADAPQDPIGSGPDTIAPVDATANNNNIAQRNNNVLDYPEVTGCGFYSTTVATDTVFFDAVNPTNKNVIVDIGFDSGDFPIGTGTLMVEPGSLWTRWTTLTNFNQGINTLTATALPATMGGIQMAPGETARMTLTIAAEIDYDFAIQVTEYVTGTDVGGIDYVRDLPNCFYLPLILKDA